MRTSDISEVTRWVWFRRANIEVPFMAVRCGPIPIENLFASPKQGVLGAPNVLDHLTGALRIEPVEYERHFGPKAASLKRSFYPAEN